MTEAEAKRACAHGQGVIYKPYAAAQPEDGVIMSCNKEFAFVLYRGDTIAKATRFEDLELARG